MILSALLTFLLTATAAPAQSSTLSAARQQDLGRIHRALNVHEQETGIRLSDSEVERKLAGMNDTEVRRFADALETERHIGNPVNVVIGTIILLIMVVVLIVRLVE